MKDTYLLSLPKDIKKVKTHLEKLGLISNSIKISKATEFQKSILSDIYEELELEKYKWIPINSGCKFRHELYFGSTISENQFHSIKSLDNDIFNEGFYLSINSDEKFICPRRKKIPESPFQLLVRNSTVWWNERLSNKIQGDEFDDLFRKILPTKWEKYGVFVLFPTDTFKGESWNNLTSQVLKEKSFKAANEVLLAYFSQVVSPTLQVTHLARKNCIPAKDILRRPSITPLYGAEWDRRSILEEYNSHLTETIFWSKVQQNSLFYVWSPLHTMFSAGNITEKSRIHSSNPVFNAEDQIVVDLYSGIGYFVFPYLIRSKAKLVYACEWNPWSIVGLLKGANHNNLAAKIEDIHSAKYSDIFNLIEQHYQGFESHLTPQIIICPGNNEDYIDVYKNQAQHVNLGLIPSSEQGYVFAALAISSETGGYLHVHENVNSGKYNLKEKAEQVVNSISLIFKTYRASSLFEWEVMLAGPPEIVKSYGPRIDHVVFDIFCKPSTFIHIQD